jgi:uncharacterized protein (UPF0254 family)
VFVILTFPLLCREAAHAYSEEADAVVARSIGRSWFKFVGRDVFEQGSVAELAEGGLLFSQVLEENL